MSFSGTPLNASSMKFRTMAGMWFRSIQISEGLAPRAVVSARPQLRSPKSSQVMISFTQVISPTISLSIRGVTTIGSSSALTTSMVGISRAFIALRARGNGCGGP